jgi:hypothetical protein
VISFAVDTPEKGWRQQTRVCILFWVYGAPGRPAGVLSTDPQRIGTASNTAASEMAATKRPSRIAMMAAKVEKDNFALTLREGVENLEEALCRPRSLKSLLFLAAHRVALCLVPEGKGKEVARQKIGLLAVPPRIGRLIASLVAMDREEYDYWFYLFNYVYKFNERGGERANEIYEFYTYQ